MSDGEGRRAAAATKDQSTSGAPVAAHTALSVVYGDLGTSPLYTIQTVLGGLGRLSPAGPAPAEG